MKNNSGKRCRYVVACGHAKYLFVSWLEDMLVLIKLKLSGNLVRM